MRAPLVAEISYHPTPLFPYSFKNKGIRAMWVWITVWLLRVRLKIRVSGGKDRSSNASYHVREFSEAISRNNSRQKKRMNFF